MAMLPERYTTTIEPVQIRSTYHLSENHKELRLLVTGKTGEGKSTLVNGLLGATVAVEGAGAVRCTTEVTEYKAKLHGVPVTVFDSPGLQDNTGNEDEYLKEMRKKCQSLSLVLYCAKMTNNRLKDEDKNAVLKLTAAFGQRFWEFAVLVLTFANHEDVSRHDERDEDKGSEPDYDDDAAWKKLGKKRFEGRLKKWKEGFQKFLIEEVGIRRDIVERIPVVPAGDHRKSRRNRTPFCLLDRENWLDELWKACILQMKEEKISSKINRCHFVVDKTIQSCRQQPVNQYMAKSTCCKLQLTDTPKVDDDTYTPKLRENIKKMDKKAWVKEQEEEHKREAEQIRKERKRQEEENKREREKLEVQIRVRQIVENIRKINERMEEIERQLKEYI